MQIWIGVEDSICQREDARFFPSSNLGSASRLRRYLTSRSNSFTLKNRSEKLNRRRPPKKNVSSYYQNIIFLSRKKMPVYVKCEKNHLEMENVFKSGWLYRFIKWLLNRLGFGKEA